MIARRSLRTQILAWFLAGLALAAGLALLVFWVGGARVFEAELIRSNQLLATAIRRQLERALAHDTQAATRLGTELVMARGDGARRTQLTQAFLLFGEIFSNAYVFDRAGKLRAFEYQPGQRSANARAGEDLHGYPGSFPAAADAAIASGQPAFTPVYITPTGRAQLSYLVPLPGRDRHTEELLSFAIYALDERVAGWIQGLAPGADGYVVVLDAHGQVIAHDGPVPKGLSNLEVTGAEAAGTVELDGREDLLIGGRLPTVGFYVWVGIPRAEVYAPLKRLKWPALLALAAVLVMGLLGAMQLSRAILRPVEDLVGGIRRVGEGVLSHRVPEGRADELGDAAAAFNQMAERLQRDQLVEEVWRDLK